MKAPRVLLSAYQCGPGPGSVSQIGWEWYSRLARKTSVTLVTHIRNRQAMESAGAPLPGTNVIFIDTEWFAGPLYRAARVIFPRSEHSVFLVSSLDFYAYDREALRSLRHVAMEHDVMHAVTPVSTLACTRLHLLGLPLVVGPWNSGLSTPESFPGIMREESSWLYRFRRLRRLIDKATGCTASASAILSATRATDASLPPACGPRVLRMCENAVDLNVFYPGEWLGVPSEINPLRVLYAGRLIPVKGVSLLLEAVARLRTHVPVQLTIAGDGPLRSELSGQAARLGLETSVTFAGNLALPEVAALMRQSHLFCLPSVRESGGAVLLEAMACGVPVLAVNYGGPAEIVDDSVGRLLSASGPQQLIADIVDACRKCAAQPQGWHERGICGHRRVAQHYSWESKVDQAFVLYNRLSNGSVIEPETEKLEWAPLG